MHNILRWPASRVQEDETSRLDAHFEHSDTCVFLNGLRWPSGGAPGIPPGGRTSPTARGARSTTSRTPTLRPAVYTTIT